MNVSTSYVIWKFLQHINVLEFKGYIFQQYRTVKNIGNKNFGKFGKVQQFTKLFANLYFFHNIPFANGLKFSSFFCQTSYISYSPNFLTAKVVLLYGTIVKL